MSPIVSLPLIVSRAPSTTTKKGVSLAASIRAKPSVTPSRYSVKASMQSVAAVACLTRKEVSEVKLMIIPVRITISAITTVSSTSVYPRRSFRFFIPLSFHNTIKYLNLYYTSYRCESQCRTAKFHTVFFAITPLHPLTKMPPKRLAPRRCCGYPVGGGVLDAPLQIPTKMHRLPS